jgi:hypothetical protein
LLPIGTELEAELRCDHDLVADRREGFADELFIRERPVGLGRVEERDPALEGRADERDHLLPVCSRAVTEAHAHAAEPDGRDPQISKLARFHRVSFQTSTALKHRPGVTLALVDAPANVTDR